MNIIIVKVPGRFDVIYDKLLTIPMFQHITDVVSGTGFDNQNIGHALRAGLQADVIFRINFETEPESVKATVARILSRVRIDLPIVVDGRPGAVILHLLRPSHIMPGDWFDSFDIPELEPVPSGPANEALYVLRETHHFETGQKIHFTVPHEQIQEELDASEQVAYAV